MQMPMIKTFTQNDLIRFIYHETTNEEESEINKALLCDSELRQRHAELLDQKRQLDQARLEPGSQVIANILNYARGLEVKQ